MESAVEISRGWSPAKVRVFKEQFFRFLGHVSINSKERGQIVLGKEVYRAQTRFLDRVFSGLAEDKHDFKHLKSRQLGVSTITRALTLFWAGIHNGLKGAMVYDTSQHTEEARLEVIGMIQSLPSELGFPRILRQNRYLVELSNGTTILFLTAGTRQTKGSGSLGRSSGINFCHASELCSWDNPEGIESFKHTLARDFPDRLYIWESTGRGRNAWYDMYHEAELDERHQVTIFSGWWAKDNQEISRADPDFEKYGFFPPTAKELDRIHQVKDLYGWQITPEQLAWVRRDSDPSAEAEGDQVPDFSGSVLHQREQAWVEEDAFLLTSSSFFQADDLNRIVKTTSSNKYKTFRYQTGFEFTECRIWPAANQREVQLKIWEEPEPSACYIVAADVAFGANERNDRSCVQVLRCYSDGLDQVAEFAWPTVNSAQFAWIILDLLGLYGGANGEAYLMLEMNGPGEAVWNEIQRVKRDIERGAASTFREGQGIRNIFSSVRMYIYTRSDSMSAGRNYQWYTSSRLRRTILERLRDFTTVNRITIRSMETIHEMTGMEMEDDDIVISSEKDDRVMTLAMAVRCYEERVRRILQNQNRSRANEAAKKRMSIGDQAEIFNRNMLESYFGMKARIRQNQVAAERRAQWRRGR